MNTRKVLIPGLVVGLIAAAACVVAALSPALRPAFFRAYLFAYIFWLGVSLGSLALPMLHNLTGGAWGITVRRIAEAASLTIPLMALLFIPIFFGLPELFPWADPAKVAAEHLLQHRQPYLNVPFFVIRAILYFVIWTALAFIELGLARRIERTGDPRTRSTLRGWSAAGLIIYLVTMTHAGTDWVMSRDLEFYSTAFGFVLTTGQTLCATAFAILVLALTHRQPDLQRSAQKGVLNDIGNILLTLVILWSYVSFMQLLVIWMGNTGEDNIYYLQRGLGQPSPWRWVGLALVVLHFFVPFFLLLFRATKRYIPTLTTIAATLFVLHIVDAFWLIAPSGDHVGPQFVISWIDPVVLLAVGGLWLAWFLLFLPARLAAAAGALEINASIEAEEAAHA